MDCIVHGVAKSWTWLSDSHFYEGSWGLWKFPQMSVRVGGRSLSFGELSLFTVMSSSSCTLTPGDQGWGSQPSLQKGSPFCPCWFHRDSLPSTTDLRMVLRLALVPGPEIVLPPQQALFCPFVLSYLPSSNLWQHLSLPLSRHLITITHSICPAIKHLPGSPYVLAFVLWVCQGLCSPTDPCQPVMPATPG